LVSPYNNEVIVEVASANEEEINEAIEAADKARSKMATFLHIKEHQFWKS
jgi:acyl-CoA reductase-like NAD-dependent aldehyde dehydrogenase